jgi:hypothetical protein
VTTRGKANSSAAIFLSPGAKRDAAISRIIAAVNKEPDDRNKLAEDIHAAYMDFAKILSGQEATSAQTRKQLTLARKALENFLKLSKSNATIKKIAEPHKLPELVSALHHREIGQLGLHNFKKQVRRRRKREGLRPYPREAAPIDLLIGLYLPRIYQDRFKGDDTWARDPAREPKGAIIAFIEAVLSSLNLSRARHTIGTALTRERRSRHLVFRPWGLPPEWK